LSDSTCCSRHSQTGVQRWPSSARWG
jgi:hypothetical protein